MCNLSFHVPARPSLNVTLVICWRIIIKHDNVLSDKSFAINLYEHYNNIINHVNGKCKVEWKFISWLNQFLQRYQSQEDDQLGANHSYQFPSSWCSAVFNSYQQKQNWKKTKNIPIVVSPYLQSYCWKLTKAIQMHISLIAS